MTKKHFIQFAEMIINLLNDEQNTDLLTINNTFDELVSILKRANPSFNIYTFHDFINQKASRKLEALQIYFKTPLTLWGFNVYLKKGYKKGVNMENIVITDEMLDDFLDFTSSE